MSDEGQLLVLIRVIPGVCRGAIRKAKEYETILERLALEKLGTIGKTHNLTSVALQNREEPDLVPAVAPGIGDGEQCYQVGACWVGHWSNVVAQSGQSALPLSAKTRPPILRSSEFMTRVWTRFVM